MHKPHPHLHTDHVAEIRRNQKIIVSAIATINEHLENLRVLSEEDRIGDVFTLTTDNYSLECMLCEVGAVVGNRRVLIITKCPTEDVVGRSYCDTKDPFDGKRHLFVKHERKHHG